MRFTGGRTIDLRERRSVAQGILRDILRRGGVRQAAHHAKGLGRDPESGGAGVGFQYAHYGHFLVAALSELGLWIIEAIMKRHQMRFYLRTRDIEVRRYGHISGNDWPGSSEDVGENALPLSSSLIDSSWFYTKTVCKGEVKSSTGQKSSVGPGGRTDSPGFSHPSFYPTRRVWWRVCCCFI